MLSLIIVSSALTIFTLTIINLTLSNALTIQLDTFECSIKSIQTALIATFRHNSTEWKLELIQA